MGRRQPKARLSAQRVEDEESGAAARAGRGHRRGEGVGGREHHGGRRCATGGRRVSRVEAVTATVPEVAAWRCGCWPTGFRRWIIDSTADYWRGQERRAGGARAGGDAGERRPRRRR